MQKILLVDDEPSHLDSLTDLILQIHDKCEVYQSANTESAIVVAQTRELDLIMLTWDMEAMVCVELINKFKTNTNTQNTPIIVITESYVSLSEVEIALQAGATDYLRKPFDHLELLARVKAGLKLSRLYQAIKRSEQTLQKQRTQLDELSREQNHLLAIVSHDLRSPLNKALGLLQFLPYDGELNEAQKTSIQMMEKVLEGGRKLIDDILIINAKEADMGVMDMKEFELVQWLRNLLIDYEITAGKKNITLHLLAPETCLLHSNEENLMRIIDNLLSNAIKFSYPDKNVNISVELQGDRVQIAVQDEGQGISEQDQRLMFKKFQKLSAKPTGNEHSTGLGLSIIKTLVTQLQGDIRVKSELGNGTTFAISLPISPKK